MRENDATARIAHGGVCVKEAEMTDVEAGLARLGRSDPADAARVARLADRSAALVADTPAPAIAAARRRRQAVLGSLALAACIGFGVGLSAVPSAPELMVPASPFSLAYAMSPAKLLSGG
jgi:hypothetical protein